MLKINNDIERIADLAVNIAQRAQCLAEFPEFVVPDRVVQMVDLTTQMVRGALNAFVNLDAGSARRIIRLDDTVDQHNREIIEDLQTQMQQRPQAVAACLHCFSAVRHVERIADRADAITIDPTRAATIRDSKSKAGWKNSAPPRTSFRRWRPTPEYALNPCQ